MESRGGNLVLRVDVAIYESTSLSTCRGTGPHGVLAQAQVWAARIQRVAQRVAPRVA